MILGLHHAALLTSDLATSRAFYEEVLGLKPSSSRPDMSFDGVWYDIATAQQIHLLALPDPEAGLARPAHGGRDRHVALTVSSLPEVQAKLGAAGIPYTMSQSGRQALFCRDPDGNALEFIEAVR